MSQDVREVAIQGDEHTAFASHNRKKLIVTGTRQVLISGERDIVASSSENGRDAVGHVLVELDGRHR
jgi:hypothetical protein